MKSLQGTERDAGICSKYSNNLRNAQSEPSFASRHRHIEFGGFVQSLLSMCAGEYI